VVAFFEDDRVIELSESIKETLLHQLQKEGCGFRWGLLGKLLPEVKTIGT
jgi:hypothetical protein